MRRNVLVGMLLVCLVVGAIPASSVSETISASADKDFFLFEPWVDGLEASINFAIYTPSNNMHWEWGDGTESDGFSGIHTYYKSGTYTVTVTLDTKHKGKITKKVKVTVDAAKSAEDLEDQNNLHRLTLLSPEISGLKVNINGVVVAPVERIEWDWGDGQKSISWFAATHTYLHSGTYTVKVTVYDKKGRTTTKEVDVILSPSTLHKGKILFDESHNTFWSASINNGYSSFANAVRTEGYQVDRSTSGLSFDVLKKYAVLVVAVTFTPPKPFSTSEIEAIKKFVHEGGGLLLIGVGWSWVDYSHKNIDAYPVNQISKEFGVSFNEDVINDPTDYYPTGGEGNPIFHIPYITDHSTTKGINEICACGGNPCSLKIIDNSVQVIIKGDEDSYTGYHNTHYYPAGTNPPILAVTEYGNGKVVFLGHDGFFANADDNEDDIGNLYEYDNKQLGLNIMHWLASSATPTTPTPTPTEDGVTTSSETIFIDGEKAALIEARWMPTASDEGTLGIKISPQGDWHIPHVLDFSSVVGEIKLGYKEDVSILEPVITYHYPAIEAGYKVITEETDIGILKFISEDLTGYITGIPLATTKSLFETLFIKDRSRLPESDLLNDINKYDQQIIVWPPQPDKRKEFPGHTLPMQSPNYVYIHVPLKFDNEIQDQKMIVYVKLFLEKTPAILYHYISSAELNLPISKETKLESDLTITSLTLSPENPKLGDKVTFSYKIENQGTRKARTSKIALFIDGKKVCEDDVNRLDSADYSRGAFSTEGPKWLGPLSKFFSSEYKWKVTAGEHEIRVVADYDEDVDESNEGNNEITRNIRT